MIFFSWRPTNLIFINVSFSLLKKKKKNSSNFTTIIVFPLGIFRRVQHPAYFSAAPNMPLPVFSGNTCTTCFATRVKRPYLTFIFNWEHHVELSPPSPLLKVCTGWKFQVLGFMSSSFNRLLIVYENVFLLMIYFYANSLTVGLVLNIFCNMLCFIQSIVYSRNIKK